MPKFNLAVLLKVQSLWLNTLVFFYMRVCCCVYVNNLEFMLMGVHACFFILTSELEVSHRVRNK